MSTNTSDTLLRKPSSITSRSAILEALKSHHEMGQDRFRADHGGYGKNVTYALTYRGTSYAPKPIIGVAFGIEHDVRPLVHTEFSGGPETNRAYERLGFFVRHISAPSASPSPSRLIDEILQGYLTARSESFAGHPMQRKFKDLATSLGTWLAPASRTRVQASSGKGTWANIPWISCLDDRITTSTQSGFYPCFLWRADMSGLYLVLMCGAKEANKNASHEETVEERIAAFTQRHMKSLRWLETRGFSAEKSIDLCSSHHRAKSYEKTTIIQKFYDAGTLPTDAELHDDLAGLFSAYQEIVYMETHSDSSPSDDTTPPVALVDSAQEFCGALWRAGLRFGKSTSDHDAFVRAFLASCLTKPFVILTGLSGSGKTQIAKQLGRWVGPGRSKIIAVRPDWTGPDSLLGYEDALLPVRDGQRAWHVPATLEFMLHAASHPDDLFVLVLDEMNLAHVERYFADLLSGMESFEPVLPNLKRDEQGFWRAQSDAWLPVPSNLLIIGTVNIDETTYMFSPKVLDRANTLEFRVHTDTLDVYATMPHDVEQGPASHPRSWLEVMSDRHWHEAHHASWRDDYAAHLKALHGLLSEPGFEFGHRVFHEALRFAAIHHAMGASSLHEVLDRQMMQKLLPRLHGARRQIEPVLIELASYAWFLGRAQVMSDPLNPPPGEAQLPVSFAKLRHMIQRVRANQFVSFAQ